MATNWNVHINGVVVGGLDEPSYQKIQDKVKQDRRIYIAQTFNVLHSLLNLVGFIFKAVPIYAFWLLVGFTLYAPEEVSGVFLEVQKNPQAVLEALRPILRVLILFTVLAASLAAMFTGKTFGYEDKFAGARARLIRQRLGVSAEGDVILTRDSSEQAV